MTPQETKRTSREITVRINDTETVAIARKAGEIREVKNALEAELGRVKTAYKGRIQEKETELTNALTAIREGQEKRVVQVDEVFDYVHNTVEIRDAKDGRLYEQRALTNEEKQIAMDFDENRAKAAQGVLPLREPVELDKVATVALPDPKVEGDEQWVPGSPDKPTHVSHGAKSWVLGAGEAATFVAIPEDIFGITVLSYERETRGTAKPQ